MGYIHMGNLIIRHVFDPCPKPPAQKKKWGPAHEDQTTADPEAKTNCALPGLNGTN